MKNLLLIFLIATMLIVQYSCTLQNSTQDEKMPLASVKITHLKQGQIQDFINLQGKTIYLKKNALASPITGYIYRINVKFGDKVRKNDVLFEIQTKENKALQSKNTGVIGVVAISDGIINELNISGTGGYVVEGATLCSIVDINDLVVQVSVPFEYNNMVKIGAKCKLHLLDNSVLDGEVSQILPTVNETDQTQNMLIKIAPRSSDKLRQLPENLNLSVQFVRTNHSQSLQITKEAIMTNEMQSEFWVMKIIDDSIAVKIPITKGIENDSLTEILSTELNLNDLIISEGAYGLPDSTIVNIEK